MAQLSLDEHIEAIAKLDLAARMKAAGFRVRKRTFWREVQTRGGNPSKAIQLCEITVGGSPTGTDGVTFAHLGAFFPEFVPLLAPWQKKLPSPPKLVDAQVKAPIGLVGPWKNPQHSWRIEAATDDGAVAKDLADAVEQHGLPYLDAAVDLEKLGTDAIPGVHPWLAVLALQRLGRKDAAKAKVDAILAADPKDYMAIASLAGRLKLPVPPRPKT